MYYTTTIYKTSNGRVRVKKYLSNIYATMMVAALASLSTTVHAHSGHYHFMGNLHSHAINEIFLVTIVVIACAFFFIKR